MITLTVTIIDGCNRMRVGITRPAVSSGAYPDDQGIPHSLVNSRWRLLTIFD